MADERFAVIVNPKAAGGKAITKLPDHGAMALACAHNCLALAAL